jgi:hypothetical protein
MINYDEFRALRDEARDELREYIRSRTLDTSRRGESVRMAHAIYLDMHGHIAVPKMNHRMRAATYRFMWQQAYRQQRKRDAGMRKMIDNFSVRVLPDIVKFITRDPKSYDLT